MLNTERYVELLNSGLSLDHYYIMVLIYNGQELPKHIRVEGFLNLLEKKGYIKDGALSDEALNLVQDEIIVETVVNEETTTTTTINPSTSNLAEWVGELHKRLGDKIESLTGKRQIRDKIKGGKSYSFLCNSVDLYKNIKKIMSLYKLKEADLNVIETALIKHIEDCNKSNSWFPIIYYYIFKDGKSQLVTDMENIADITTEEEKSSFTGETFI